MQVEVRPEDEDPLSTLAFNNHRSMREQASYLLHLKIHEESLKLDAEPAADAVAA